MAFIQREREMTHFNKIMNEQCNNLEIRNFTLFLCWYSNMLGPHKKKAYKLYIISDLLILLFYVLTDWTNLCLIKVLKLLDMVF